MSRVGYRIALGTSLHTSGGPSALTRLSVKAALDVPVNQCCATFAPVESLQCAVGDPMTVELGSDDSLQLVFTGAIASVCWTSDCVGVEADGCFRSLVTSRFNLVYETAKAGDVISDVAARLGLSTGTIEDGLDLPVCAIGDNASLYHQLRRLAWLSAADLYADENDSVVFARYSPATTHSFRHGGEILGAAADERSVLVSGVELYGESPASLGQGSAASTWLTKGEVVGSAGTGASMTVRISEPSIKDLNGAATAAGAVLQTMTRGRRGRVHVLGAPQVHLAEAVQIDGSPAARLNGTFKVVGVEHVLGQTEGLTTVIDWMEV